MNFEWDVRKAATNLRRHAVSSTAGARALAAGNVLERPDERQDYGEERTFALALLGGQVLAIAYTVRGDAVRLISVRRASRHETKTYWKSYGQTEDRQ